MDGYERGRPFYPNEFRKVLEICGEVLGKEMPEDYLDEACGLAKERFFIGKGTLTYYFDDSKPSFSNFVSGRRPSPYLRISIGLGRPESKVILYSKYGIYYPDNHYRVHYYEAKLNLFQEIGKEIFNISKGLKIEDEIMKRCEKAHVNVPGMFTTAGTDEFYWA